MAARKGVRVLRRWGCAWLCLWLALLPAAGLAADAETGFTYPYGVFLSCDETQADRFAPYKTVVLDAAYFSAQSIRALKAEGLTVYTYCNVGSLEDFRPYYDQFAASTLAPYENWEGERWMDVTDVAWQTFLTDTLAAEDLQKGVDGFFIDNCDVYSLYPTAAVFDSLAGILRKLRATGAAVLINGGDEFVTAYANRYGAIDDAFTGVNQETVFSAIDFAHGTFHRAKAEDRAYFTEYLSRVAALGGQVYLLEYTRSAKLKKEIAAFCEQMGYTGYVSDSIELD